MYFSKFPNRWSSAAFAVGLCFLLPGCGGGSGAGAQSSGGSYVAGTAAFGAPMAGATIEVLDARGQIATASADENGEYRVAVDGFQGPLLLTASVSSGESVRTYHALTAAAPAAGITAHVNVTPLTDAIVALASSDGASPQEFAQTNGAVLARLDPAKVGAAEEAVKASIKPFVQEVGLSEFDPVKTPFKADSVSPGDKILDEVRVSLDGDRPAIERVPSPANGLPYPATYSLTPLLKSWARQINDCLERNPEKRVMLDAEGKPLEFLGKCKFLMANSPGSPIGEGYIQNGYTFLELWGKRLRHEIPQGAKLETPQIIGFYQPDGVQHMVLRLSYESPAGGGTYVEVVRRTGADSWVINGNQQAFDAEVTSLVTRDEDASTNGYVPTSGPDAGKNVGSFSAYTSRLAMRFNPRGPNAENVYAVRVTGPGLPAAGVVLARSSACGTSESLTFFSNNGMLPNVPQTAAIPLVSPNNSNAYTLAVAPLSSTRPYVGQDFFNDYRGRNADGTPLTSPFSRVAYPQVDVSTIPLFAEYTFEVIKLVSSPSVYLTSSSFKTHLFVRPMDPARAARLSWARMSDAARQFVSPGGGFAGEQTSATLSWTVAKNAPPVRSAYLLGSGVDSSFVTRRMAMDESVVPPGGKSIALSATNERNGNNQTCDFEKIPAFSATSGTREIATRQIRVSGLIFRGSIFHNGRPAAQ